MKDENNIRGLPYLQKLTKTEGDILILLASMGEASKYDLYQKAIEIYKEEYVNRRPSYSSYHNGVKNLLKKNLIEISKTLPSKKNPKIEVEYYRLTRDGIIRLLMPLHQVRNREKLYGKIVKEKDQVFAYIPGLVKYLLKNYPDFFPEEFKEFSEDFGLALALDFCYFYIDAILWEISPIIRTYAEPRDTLQFYIDLLLCKIGDQKPKEKYDKDLIDLMTEKDVKVMIRMIERLLKVEKREIKRITRLYESHKEQIDKIKQKVRGAIV